MTLEKNFAESFPDLTHTFPPAHTLSNAMRDFAESRYKKVGQGENGEGETAESAKGRNGNGNNVPQNVIISQELQDLIRDFCAHFIDATEFHEVQFHALAKRLGAKLEQIQQVADILNRKPLFWPSVMNVRIKHARSSRIFKDSSWSHMESLATTKLVKMLEAGLIRDTGELLAIASQARRVSTNNDGNGQQGNQTVLNVNIGGDGAVAENGLPAAGARMTIDLSPRFASSLEKRLTPQKEGRVIDGEMLNATQLRELLAQKSKNEGESK